MEDTPGTLFVNTSLSGAWELVLECLTGQRSNVKLHASGPDKYGLINVDVIKYIQEMP